jgi:hypothetical protein
MHDKATGQITRIARASLVNTPNLRDLIALHSQQDMQMNDMERLAEAMGLEAGATVDQMIEAIKSMKTPKMDTAAAAMQSAIGEIGVALGVEKADPATVVAAAKLMGGLRSQVSLLQSQIVEMQSAQSRAASEAFYDNGLREKRAGFGPEQREHWITLHMSNPELAKSLAGGMVKMSASGMAVLPPAAKDGEVSLNAEQIAVAAALGIPLAAYLKTLQAEKEAH